METKKVRIKIKKRGKKKMIFVLIAILAVAIILVVLGAYYLFYRSVPLNSENIIGEWKAVSEETAGGVYYEIDNIIVFSNDGGYRLDEFGLDSSGKYKLFDNKILFYNNEEELQAYLEERGRFNEAYGEIKQGKLILSYPNFPKTVVYEKK